MPFNGINPNSGVILDNCAICHVEEIAGNIESVGAFVLYFLTRFHAYQWNYFQ